MQKDSLIKLLNKYLKTEKRIIHSISTADFMEKYSKDFKVSKEKSYIIGLLHDLAKDQSEEKIIELSQQFIKRNIIEIKYLDFKKKHTFLLHGVAAAEIVINELDITDNEILESICCHTLGGNDISKLARYAFIADFCEPKRVNVHSKAVNRMLTIEKDFEKAYFYSYFFLIYYLIRKQKEICPESIDGYNNALKLYK